MKSGANTGAIILAHNEFAKQDKMEDKIISKSEGNMDDKDIENKGMEDGEIGGVGENGGGEPATPTIEEKIEAVIELLQNLVGRVEAIEDMTAPTTGEEEKTEEEAPEEEAGEENSGEEFEKMATQLATNVATNAIDQVAKALPGMINKSLKNAGIIHAPRPKMTEEAGKPLEKQDDRVLTVEEVSKMGKDDLRQAGNVFANMVTRGGR